MLGISLLKPPKCRRRTTTTARKKEVLQTRTTLWAYCGSRAQKKARRRASRKGKWKHGIYSQQQQMIHAEIKALVSAVNIAAVTAGRQTAQKQKRQHKTWHLPTDKRVREGAVGAERMGSSISWCPTVVCLMDQSVRPYKGHHFRFCFSCCCCCFSCCCCCLCCAYFNWHFDCFAVRDFVLCAIHAFDCLTARGRGLGGGVFNQRGSGWGRGVKQLLKWRTLRRLTNCALNSLLHSVERACERPSERVGWQTSNSHLMWQQHVAGNCKYFSLSSNNQTKI